MATQSPTSSAIMDQPKEGPVASPEVSIGETLNEDTTQRAGSTQERQHSTSMPKTKLSIPPTPYMTLQSPEFSPHNLTAPPNNERSYLLENRQRQHERGERLLDALHIIDVRITSIQSKAEGRKLRKEAGLLRKKVAESLRQEQLITLRLNDIDNEELNRTSYWQAQSAGLIPYPTSWNPHCLMMPWSPMALPMMSPIHGPVSPLTPLPPGVYHPSPIMPSPMTSPYWLGAQYQYPFQTMAPYAQIDPAYHTGAEFQQSHMTEEVIAGQQPRRKSTAPANAKPGETKHRTSKSVDFRLPQEGTFKGRRWSLADAFSPTPKDKRMSIPALETIWKDNKEKEEQVSEKGHVEVE